MEQNIPTHSPSNDTLSAFNLAQIGVLIVSYTIYLCTISPTVYWNDSGELITAAHCLGMAHSPSFPLYVLSAKLAAFLPFGSIAFRVNLISVIFGCFTILILFNIITYVVGHETNSSKGETEGEFRSLLSVSCLKYYVPGIAASFMFALTHAFWLQSVRAEVYTLNTLLVGLIMFLLLNRRDISVKEEGELQKRESFLFLTALVFGLSLCNHSLLTIYLTPAILYIVITDRIQITITPRIVFLSFFFFLLGLSLYLYLPVRSVNNPIMDWNNPETLEQFMNAFSRKRELNKFFTYSNPLARLQVYVFMMIREFTFFFYWLGIIGIWLLYKKKFPIAIFTTSAFLFNMFGTVSSSNLSTQNPDILGYLTISYFIYAIWMGVGFSFLIDFLLSKTCLDKYSLKLFWRMKNRNTRSRLLRYFTPVNDAVAAQVSPTRAQRGVVVFAIMFIILSPLVLFFSNLDRSDKRNHYFTREYGISIMRTIEDDSIFFLLDDNTAFSLMYLVDCEKRREDIRLFDQDGVLNRTFIQQKQELYSGVWMPNTKELRCIQKKYKEIYDSKDKDKNKKEKSIPLWAMKVMEQVVSRNTEHFIVYWESGRYDSIVDDRLIPNGLIFRLFCAEKAVLTPDLIEKHNKFWNVKYQKLMEDEEFLSDSNATKAYSFSLSYLGNFFRKRGMFEEAVDYFKASIRLSPNKPFSFNNLGYCYLQLGRFEDAEREFLTVLELFGYYEEAHLNLGVVYARRGDYQKAKREWEMVLEKNPESAIVKENLEKLRVKSEKL